MPQKQTLLEVCESHIRLATALFFALKWWLEGKQQPTENMEAWDGWRRRHILTTPLLVWWECHPVFLVFRKLTHTDVKGKHVAQRQDRIFELIWFHSPSSWSLHLRGISSSTLGAKHSNDNEGRASLLRTGGQRARPQGGCSDPTLWELLSPLTGEPQDLLDITGLRGGLPKTNISLFKSAWKIRKKLISSCPHSMYGLQEELSCFAFSCTRSMPNSWTVAERGGFTS